MTNLKAISNAKKPSRRSGRLLRKRDTSIDIGQRSLGRDPQGPRSLQRPVRAPTSRQNTARSCDHMTGVLYRSALSWVNGGRHGQA